MQKISSFLMFNGKAEEAMNFYMSLFQNSTIVKIEKYGANEPHGDEGKVKLATFTLNRQEYMCIDSNIKHAFNFTPSLSLFVKCETEKEIDELFAKLSDGGEILMPLAPYPFSPKYAWLSDKYGVSWQLSLINNL